MTRTLPAALLVLVLSGGPVLAQVRGSAELALGWVRARAATPANTTHPEGPAVDVRVALSLERAGLELRYLQASLDDEREGRSGFSHADVMFTWCTGSLVTPFTGFGAQTIIEGTSARRWWMWRTGGRLASPAFGRGRLGVYGAIWVGAAGVNIAEGTGFTAGIESGLLVRWPGRPFVARLAYRLDDARLDDSAIRTTREQLTLGAGYTF